MSALYCDWLRDQLTTVDSGNSKRLNSKQSLISETGRLFYNINYMLNSKYLSLLNKIGDKTEFTITRVHCISKQIE